MGRRIGGQRGETDDEERKGKASIKTTAQTEREGERESVALRHSAAATD